MSPENNKNQSNIPTSVGFIMTLKPATNQETRKPSSLVRLYDLPTSQEKQVITTTIKTQLSLLEANGVVFDGDYLLSLIEQPLDAFRDQYPSEADDFVIDVRGDEEYVRILLYSRYGQVVQITSRLTSVSLDKTSTEVIQNYVPIILEQRVEQEFGIIRMATMGAVKGFMSTLSPEEQEFILFLRNNSATIEKLHQLSSVFTPISISPKDIHYDVESKHLKIGNWKDVEFSGEQQNELLRSFFGHPGQNPASLSYETLYKRIEHKDWYAATKDEQNVFITSLRRRARGINNKVCSNLFEVKKKRCSISPYL